MKIAQLEFLAAVEDTGSINQAANDLLVSQSLISTSIKSLESELGRPLLTRSSKGIKLTPFGKEFLPYARSVLAQINQMKALGSSVDTASCSFTVCNNNYRFVVEILSQLINKHGNEHVRFCIKDCSRQEAIELLSNKMADVAVMRIWSYQTATMKKQLKSKNVIFCPLTIAPTVAVVGPKNPLFDHKGDAISSEMLKPFPIISYEYSMYNPNISIQTMLPNLQNNSTISISTRNAAEELLNKTNAFILTAANFDSSKDSILDYDNCRAFKILDCPYTAQIGYMKHKDADFSSISQEFIDMLSDYL